MSYNYNFYPRTINDKPHSVRVNMDSDTFLDRHPHLMILNISYEQRENGFPLSEEFERLNGIEDALDEVLEAEGVIHIGAITGNGTVIHFYALKTMEAMEAFVNDRFGDNLDLKLKPSESQVCFDEFLSPNVYERNYIFNQQVCSNMENTGEKFEVERDVDFYTYFKDLEQAQKYASHFEDFAHTINIREDEDKKICVHLVANIIPHLGFMNGVTDSILDLTDIYEGDFDGWGSPIEN